MGFGTRKLYKCKVLCKQSSTIWFLCCGVVSTCAEPTGCEVTFLGRTGMRKGLRMISNKMLSRPAEEKIFCDLLQQSRYLNSSALRTCPPDWHGAFRVDPRSGTDLYGRQTNKPTNRELVHYSKIILFSIHFCGSCWPTLGTKMRLLVYTLCILYRKFPPVNAA